MGAQRVLVVDDDAAFRKTVCSALSIGGHDVVDASGGAAALRALRAMPEAPQVLLTELSMPEGDGIELITAVRRLWPTTRILACASKPTVGGLDLLHLARMLGAEATFRKPVDVDDIVRAAAA